MHMIVENYAIIDEGLILSSFMIGILNCFTISMGSRVDPKGSRHLFRMALCSWLLTLTYFLDLVLMDEMDYRLIFLRGVFLSIKYILMYVIMYFSASYLIYQIEGTGKKVRWRKLINIIGLIYAVINVIDLFYPLLYRLENNQYYAGNLYIIQDIMFCGVFLGIMCVLVYYRDYLRKEVVLSYTFMLIAPALAFLSKRIWGGIDIMEVAITISVFILGWFVETRQVVKYMQHEEELSKLHSQLVLSQLRPHFLYNALSSISQLCKYDPKQASVMTDNFNEFLTKNLRDVIQSEPLAFEQELKYIESYIAIEKMRFGDDLKVIYNIEERDFYVPPMVIQPIIENSIKHGLGAKEEGGHLYISTRKFKDGYGIIIADDGVGYDTKAQQTQKDDRVHVGLASIRQRLKYIPGAQIVMESKIGQGSMTFLVIPETYADRIRNNSKINEQSKDI